jgi:hypothetical protein
MNWLLFLFSIILTGTAVYNQGRLLKLADRLDRVIAYFVLAAANIVLSTYILSELYWISCSGYLAIEAIVAVLSILAFKKFGEPLPAGSIVPLAATQTREEEPVIKWILRGFLAVIVLAALFRLFIGVYAPTIVIDGMTCHLSRVGYWLQNGTLHHYYTQTEIQNFQPLNAQVFILWTAAILKSDILANVIQWAAYCGIGLTIFQAARNLGAGKQNARLSSLIFLSLPMVVLQSISTFYDMGVSFFTITFFYFFHKAVKTKDKNKLLLSAVSLGLAVGSKGTVFYMFPPLLIAGIVLMFLYKIDFSFIKRAAAYFVLGFLLFGAYGYIQNMIHYGSPLASKDALERAHGVKKRQYFSYYLAMHVFDSVDFRGLPDILVNRLNETKKSFHGKYMSGAGFKKAHPKFGTRYYDGYNNNSSAGWYGILGTLLYIPVLLAGFFLVIFFHRGKHLEKWLYILIPFFFFFFIVYLQGYTLYKSRYFILAFAFIAPLTAFIFRVKYKYLKIIVVLLVTLMAVKTTVQCSLYSHTRPLSGKMNIFNGTLYQNRKNLRDKIPLVRFLYEFLPGNCRLGHILELNSPDYLFFDRKFERTVIPIKKEEMKNSHREIMQKYNLDFLALMKYKQELHDLKRADPVFFYSNYWRGKRYLVVKPRDNNWDLAMENRLRGIEKEEIIREYLRVFSGAGNLNIPLRLLLQKAENCSSIKSFKIGNRDYAIPLEKSIQKLNIDGYSYDVLTYVPVKEKIKYNIIIKGEVQAPPPGQNQYTEAELLDEKGKTITRTRVMKNNVFNFKIPGEMIYPPKSPWKLFQVRAGKEKDKIPLNRLSVGKEPAPPVKR